MWRVPYSGSSSQWNLRKMDILGTSVLFRGCPFFGGRDVWTIERQGVNSVYIVVRLSTLQSVHYQRFHCRLKRLSITLHRGTVGWLILMVSSLWLGIPRATPTGYHCTTSCRACVRFLMLRLPPVRREGVSEGVKLENKSGP